MQAYLGILASVSTGLRFDKHQKKFIHPSTSKVKKGHYFDPYLFKDNVFQAHERDAFEHTTSTGEKAGVKRYDYRELYFWFQYGIDAALLAKYGVVALAYYVMWVKNGQYLRMNKAEQNSPMYGILITTDCFKVYRPYLKTKDFKFIQVGRGMRPSNWLFGHAQLEENGDVLFITGGEKDCLTLAARGFNAISAKSETCWLPDQIAEDIIERFKVVVTVFDNDATGIEGGKKFAEKYGFYPVVFPAFNRPNGFTGKDVADFFENDEENEQLPRFVDLVYTQVTQQLLADGRAKKVEVMESWKERGGKNESRKQRNSKIILI